MKGKVEPYKKTKYQSYENHVFFKPKSLNMLLYHTPTVKSEIERKQTQSKQI